MSRFFNVRANWFKSAGLLFAIALMAIAPLYAAEPVSKSRFLSVAIGGHDAVAYHALTPRSPASNAMGKKAHVVKYKGAKWRFQSRTNADMFRANPERYKPAYNGHCANALSFGQGLVRTDGAYWEIFGDKLYLFYDASGRELWMDGNWDIHRMAADVAWQEMLNK